MERSLVTLSAANFITVNLMVLVGAAAFGLLARTLRGRSNG
jgi:hypothetical protein